MKMLSAIFLFLGIFVSSVSASVILPEEINVASSTFHIQVNYDLRLDFAIRDGQYDWEHDLINDENFPITRKGTAELDIVLVHLDINVSSEEAIKELDKAGYRPAELQEFLAFGAKYPDEQRKYPIVALGSVWRYLDGRRFVPCLWGNGGKRGLNLRLFAGEWNAVYRFAGVRK